MKELEKCLDFVKRIKEIDEQIEMLRFYIDSPRTSVYSDTPKGGGGYGNPLEQYMIKLEDLEEKRHKASEKLINTYKVVRLALSREGFDDQAEHMMMLRFYRGLQWKKCAEIMKKKYPSANWNVNKCFRTYRRILYKINKSNV